MRNDFMEQHGEQVLTALRLMVTTWTEDRDREDVDAVQRDLATDAVKSWQKVLDEAERVVEGSLGGSRFDDIDYVVTISDRGTVVVEREREGDEHLKRVTFDRHSRMAHEWLLLAHQADSYIDGEEG